MPVDDAISAEVELPPIVFDPELIFGIARPVGARDKGLEEQLENSLKNYGYSVTPIKLSGILQDAAVEADRWSEPDNEHDRIARLMDEGDAFCRAQENGAAVALLAVNEIRAFRQMFDAKHEEGQAAGIVEVARHAYVIDSIKRPAEVTELRRIYGDRFFLLGLQTSEAERRMSLSNKIRLKVMNLNESERLTDELIQRDFRDGDEFGQNILKTFPMSDAFIESGDNVLAQVRRLVDLLFGNPRTEPPTTAEFAMQLAWTVSTRSPELGLKVGAAILSGEHVLSTGTNHHPVLTKSPEVDQSVIAINELFLDTISVLHYAGLLAPEVSERFASEGETYVEELIAGPLSTARLKELTEFQLPVHAEMDALIDGLGQSAKLDGATVYVTAYPCHNCAKHLLALGLSVVYLEPYPKSRAEAMYGSDVRERFMPFTGVSPRRYAALFSVESDRKNADGSQIEWSSEEMKSAKPRVDTFLDPSGVSRRESFVLEKAGFPL